MGKRKYLDTFLLIAGIVLAVLAVASFIVSLINANIMAAIFGLFNALVTVVLIARVLLLAKDANDSDKTIIGKEDIRKLTDKME